MARLNSSVMVLDHLDNRVVNCPPYTAATISRNRLYLSPGIDGICLTNEAFIPSLPELLDRIFINVT